MTAQSEIDSQWVHDKDINGVIVSVGDVVCFLPEMYQQYPGLKPYMEDNNVDTEYVVVKLTGINHVKGMSYVTVERNNGKIIRQGTFKHVVGDKVYGQWNPRSFRVVR